MDVGSDLSIVVQGSPNTDATFDGKSISSSELLGEMRELFPAAEIIVSTWKQSAFPQVNCLLEELDDPGAQYVLDPDTNKPKSFNFNRLLISTQAGLKRASRPFVLKLRSDTRVVSARFRRFFNDHSGSPRKPSLFNQRVLVSAYFSRDPTRSGRIFHPSDMIQYGRLEDLRKLWNGQPVADSRLPQIAASGMAPEQIVILDCLRREHWRNRDDWNERFSFSNIRHSEQLLASEFVIAEPELIGVQNADRFTAFSNPRSCYTFSTWKELNQSLERPLYIEKRALWGLARQKLSRIKSRLGRYNRTPLTKR